MKRWLWFPFILIVIVIGCKNDTPTALDELNKRWHLNRTRQAQDSAWVVYDTIPYYDIEYRPDGTLIYRRNGIIYQTPCCYGGRFKLDGMIITYTDFPSCPLSLCASGSMGKITILKEDLLEIVIGDYVRQYIPVR